jgi:hypothetical protein
MVTHLNITLDDDVADDARDIKNELGITWPEFIEEATDALDDGADAATEPYRTTHDPEHTRDRTRDRTAPSDDDVKIDVPGSNQTADARRQAVLDMRDRLRELGTAEKSDLLECIDSDDVNYSSLESFWSNVVKGRDSLKSLNGVEPPAEGGRTWRWTGG